MREHPTTTPGLHWATVKSGLLTINKGAPKAGSLSFALNWAATVLIAAICYCCVCVRGLHFV